MVLAKQSNTIQPNTNANLDSEVQHNLFVKQLKYYILNETVYFKQNHLPQANSCITVISNTNCMHLSHKFKV